MKRLARCLLAVCLGLTFLAVAAQSQTPQQESPAIPAPLPQGLLTLPRPTQFSRRLTT
ncbi:MAG TPA: hypothetical protein VLY23_00755 [Candidatus Acidoferrum sp.]|nr:hypothetical protein [Candidatus Acidoferrum sp.]